MKRRVLIKLLKRALRRNLPTIFKQSAIRALINISPMHSWFQFNDCPYVIFERFSTSLHKGVVSVSEYDCVDKIHFSSWYHAMIWICKQAKHVSEYEVHGPEYIVDSGHYRYRVYFPKNQE